jgi:hypothetical protein
VRFRSLIRNMFEILYSPSVVQWVNLWYDLSTMRFRASLKTGRIFGKENLKVFYASLCHFYLCRLGPFCISLQKGPHGVFFEETSAAGALRPLRNEKGEKKFEKFEGPKRSAKSSKRSSKAPSPKTEFFEGSAPQPKASPMCVCVCV